MAKRNRRSDKKKTVLEHANQQAIIDGPNGKIFVGIPRERVYIPAFVDNRDNLLGVLQNSSRGLGYYQAESHRVDRNRDGIVNHFLNLPSKPPWLLMIDTDMEHPADAGIRLSAHGKPIIGALYFHRGKKHDPFVFKRGPNGKDTYGRDQMKWEPLRDEVFDFLETNNVPMQDGSVTLDGPTIDPLISCDAIATGCMLIHREVLEAMEAPWFEYPAGGYSEDLWFCNKAKFDYGFDIYCDISTICGHFHWTPMGQAQFRQVYRNFGVNATTYSQEAAAEWFADCFDLEYERAQDIIVKGSPAMVGDYWLSKNPKTDKEVQDFYEDPHTGRLYTIELLYWNTSDVFENMRFGLVGFRNQEILEIGGGIGTVAMQLALQQNNVTMIEPNDTLRKFSEYRWKKLMDGLWGKRGAVDFRKTLEVDPEKYDIAVALDVLEHLPYDLLAFTLKQIWLSLKPGGTFAFHANFKQQDLYPMHYDHSDIFEALMIDSGFVIETNFRARKVMP